MALAPSHTPHPAGVEFGSLLGLLFFSVQSFSLLLFEFLIFWSSLLTEGYLATRTNGWTRSRVEEGRGGLRGLGSSWSAGGGLTLV